MATAGSGGTGVDANRVAVDAAGGGAGGVVGGGAGDPVDDGAGGGVRADSDAVGRRPGGCQNKNSSGPQSTTVRKSDWNRF